MSGAPRPDDHEAVLGAFAELDAACEGESATAICRLFAPDPDATFWGSAEIEEAVGPDEILDLAEKIVAAAGRFRIAWSDRRVRVNGDTAWINATGAATWETEGTVRRLPYRLTGVLVRRDGVWLWHTHHGSEPEASS